MGGRTDGQKAERRGRLISKSGFRKEGNRGEEGRRGKKEERGGGGEEVGRKREGKERKRRRGGKGMWKTAEKDRRRRRRRGKQAHTRDVRGRKEGRAFSRPVWRWRPRWSCACGCGCGGQQPGRKEGKRPPSSSPLFHLSRQGPAAAGKGGRREGKIEGVLN